MFPNMFPKEFSGFFSTPDPSAMDDMMKPGRDAFEFWISFFPTAPLFGVEWRFGDMETMSKSMMMPMGTDAMSKAMMGMDTFMKSPATKPAKSNGEAKPVVSPAPAAKAAPKPTPAPVAKEPAAPKKADTVAEAVPAPVKVKAAPKPKAEAKQKAAAKTKAAPAAPDGKPASLMSAKPAKADDLKLIKGIGPGLEKELNRLGVYQFEQMAAFKKADLEWIDTNLSAFKGRCFRDDWTGQAKSLIS
ncbi:MAG: hypothetical protein AAF409_04780 [Pseudomonadota bacterium]